MNDGNRAYRMEVRQSQVDATRQAILDATHELWLELPYDAMTLDAIAERAGSTRQTVLRHFGSKDNLVFELGAWVSDGIDEMGDHRGLSPQEALDRLVERYETFGDANARLGNLEGRFEFADEWLSRGRAGHRTWIEEVFEHHLGELSRRDRRQTVDALYAATDVFVWKLLRRDFARSKEATRATIGALVSGVLARANHEIEGPPA